MRTMTRITIVGTLGKFGTVLARKFLESGYDVGGIDIASIEGHPLAGLLSHYHQAEESSFFNLPDEIKQLIKTSDILLLATPVESIGEAISVYGKYLPANALLVDVASVKTPAESSMRKLNRHDIELLSIHPLFGPAVDFQGENVAVVEVHSGSRTKKFLDLLESWGCQLVRLSATEHDYKMAYIQCLCHALVIVLGQTGKTEEISSGIFKLTTPFSRGLFQLLDRIAKADPRLYTAIQMTNPYTLSVIDVYLSQIQQFRSFIARKDYEAMNEYITSSATFLELLKQEIE